jgi:hypothetical protein
MLYKKPLCRKIFKLSIPSAECGMAGLLILCLERYAKDASRNIISAITSNKIDNHKGMSMNRNTKSKEKIKGIENTKLFVVWSMTTVAYQFA